MQIEPGCFRLAYEQLFRYTRSIIWKASGGFDLLIFTYSCRKPVSNGSILEIAEHVLKAGNTPLMVYGAVQKAAWK